MPSDRHTATDFVQDYAAKRAAQLERAKKIREARLQINQQQSAAPLSSTNNSSNKQHNPASVDNVNSDVGVATSILPITARGRRIATVVEEDFKRATRAGIITPDQARQLWAMLSDQLVQVDPTESSTSNSTNYNSFPHTLKSSAGSTIKFGNSISIDSLRASIAQFKELQKQEREQQKQQDVRIKPKTKTPGAKSSNTVNEVYELATRVFAPQSHAAAAATGSAGAAMPRPPRKEQSRTDSNDYGGLSNETQEPSTSNSSIENWGLRQGSTPPRAKGQREKQQQQQQQQRMQKRPPWNFDVDVGSNDVDDATTFLASSKQPPLCKGRKVVTDNKINTQKRYTNNITTQFDETPVGVQSSRQEIQQEQQYAQAFPSKTGGSKKSINNLSQKQSSQRPVSFDDIVVAPGAGGGRGVADASFPAQPQQKEPLLPCEICGRTFRESILSRHIDACAKMQKKRKVFDAKQHRLEGLDGIKEACVSGPSARGSRKQQQQQQQQQQSNFGAPAGAGQNKMPKWKIQHEQFQAAMRAMKQMSTAGNGGGGKGAPLPPPPPPMPEEYDDRVPCPHCGRKFAELTAQRHIPKCMTTIAKPKGIRPTRR